MYDQKGDPSKQKINVYKYLLFKYLHTLGILNTTAKITQETEINIDFDLVYYINFRSLSVIMLSYVMQV